MISTSFSVVSNVQINSSTILSSNPTSTKYGQIAINFNSDNSISLGMESPSGNSAGFAYIPPDTASTPAECLAPNANSASANTLTTANYNNCGNTSSVQSLGAGGASVSTTAATTTTVATTTTTTTQAAPSTPINFVGTAAYPNLLLSWASGSGASPSSYLIYNGSGALIATLPGSATTYSISSYADPGSNTYSIAATNGNETSATASVTITLAANLYVANYGSDTISVINTSTNEPTAAGSDNTTSTITVGSGPDIIVASPDNRYLYVTNVNSNSVSVIDVAKGVVVDTIALPSNASPQGIVLNPAGTLGYVVNNGNSTVSVINLATNTVTATYALPSGAAGAHIAISPSGSTLYVTDGALNELSVLNAATGAIEANIPTGSGSTPYGVAVSPDGQTIYVGGFGDGSVSVISAATNTVTTKLFFNTPVHNVTFNPQGTLLYVSLSIANRYDVVDPTNNTITSTEYPVTSYPVDMAFQANGQNAYTGDFGNAQAQELFTGTTTVGQSITVGPNPLGLAIVTTLTNS